MPKSLTCVDRPVFDSSEIVVDHTTVVYFMKR